MTAVVSVLFLDTWRWRNQVAPIAKLVDLCMRYHVGQRGPWQRPSHKHHIHIGTRFQYFGQCSRCWCSDEALFLFPKGSTSCPEFWICGFFLEGVALRPFFPNPWKSTRLNRARSIRPSALNPAALHLACATPVANGPLASDDCSHRI